jgi:hypothetical protein
VNARLVNEQWIFNLQELDKSISPRVLALSRSGAMRRVSRMIADPAFRLG